MADVVAAFENIVSVRRTAWLAVRRQFAVGRAFGPGARGGGQESDDAGEEVGVVGAGADAVAVADGRAACQWSGKYALRSPAAVGKRVKTSCSYAHGSTPRRRHVDAKLSSTAAVAPPRGEPTNSQFLRPMAICFISRSATLLSMSKKPASV